MTMFKRVLMVTTMGVGALTLVMNPVAGLIALGIGFVSVASYDSYKKLPKR